MNPTLLQSTSLDIAAARSLPVVLSGLVDGLAADPQTVLARIWLIQAGDQCSACNMRSECETQVDCLHLVASAGTSKIDPERDYKSLAGSFRRFPLGVRKIGLIAGTGEALNLNLEEGKAPWAAVPDWIHSEGIHSFAGQPLMFQGQTVGVLALFSRKLIPDEDFHWLRTFADHAAVAIANARAFEEVAKLKEQLEQERDYLREEVRVDMNRRGFIGQSLGLAQVLRQVDLVSATEASVLIHGETGTGKEHVATMLHEGSGRATGPMVRVNCASIPRELFESEFFGHKRGAFTGATQDRVGKFEIADGGTLFLDEVGEIPLELQGKLLRVLQEGTYSRIGEDRTRSVDVRVVAATNKDLKREAADGNFREDLYYRLAVFPIEIPPLRERREDIPLLATFFLQRTTIRSNKTGLVLRNRDVKVLSEYDWPGNVRELQNVIERAAILATADRLHFDLAPVDPARLPAPKPGANTQVSTAAVRTDAQIRTAEANNLRLALEQCGWRVSGASGAAALLGIKPTTLASRMKSMAVTRPGTIHP
ncbi:MAG: transcriptional regulator with GAF, ATPase, and Fis domain [Glaciecola sp.]|jgi:transcriptional regulator with GAF, ATPase, and Fis domain